MFVPRFESTTSSTHQGGIRCERSLLLRFDLLIHSLGGLLRNLLRRLRRLRRLLDRFLGRFLRRGHFLGRFLRRDHFLGRFLGRFLRRGGGLGCVRYSMRYT